MSNVHAIATSGFGEGTNDLYDAARPSYPAAALKRIQDALPTPHDRAGLVILEPGSGTGIFSRLLLSPPSPEYPAFDIKTLVSIEPSSGMRGAWDRGLAKLPPSALEGKQARTVAGAFDDFSASGVAKGTVDAIVIAQAWHWCPDHEKALREAASYLHPNGVLIFIWNLESNREGYHREIREHYQPYDLGTPQYWKGWWRACFETPAYEELFQPAVEAKDPWELGMTEDGLVNRLFSKSYLTEAHLNGDKREEFERRLREIIRTGEKQWMDEKNGVFKYTYDTDTVVMRKKP